VNYKLKRRLDSTISDLSDKKITLEELTTLLSTNNISRERVRPIGSKAIRKMRLIPKAYSLLEGLMEG